MNGKVVVIGALHAVVGPPGQSPRRAAKVGGEPPEWIQIFPDGEYSYDWQGKKETALCDAESRALVLEAFEARGNDLVVDYEHQTLDGDQAPAAGWIRDLEDRGVDGLWARVEWTDRAAEYLRSGEYRYDSPVFTVNKESRRVVALHHIALTNWPASHNRTALTEQIAAKAQAKYELKALRGGTMENILEQLRWLLGRPVTATHNEIRADLEKLLAAIPADDAMLVEAKADETPQTFANALSVVIATSEETEPATGSVEAAVVATKEVLDELELAEGATLAQVQARIVEIRTPAACADPEHQRALSELKSTKDRLSQLEATTEEERVTQLISANRRKITPARESWVRATAKKFGVEHAAEVVRNLRDELPETTTIDQAPPAPIDTVVATTRRVGDKELPVDPDSAQRAAKVRAIQAEKPALSYREADEELSRRERAGS